MSSEAWPFYDDDEVQAVAEVLRSGRVNQWTGENVFAFENEFARRLNAPHAIAVANGTVALEIALRAYQIGPGDEVIVPSRSFVASASCVLSVGATPVFCDIDENSQNATVETITPRLTSKTKAIIPVHLAGWPCDMPAIRALADKHNLIVIEDCAQAVGATVRDQPVGTFGHVAAFSFCQDKIISTGGEGGMIVFQDPDRATWARSYKDHGKNFSKMDNHDHGYAFAYVHDAVGTNLRMTEMQAAVGRCQLAKLDHWIELRNANAKIWRAAFQALNCLKIPVPADDCLHAYYRFYAIIDKTHLRPGVDRSQILADLNAQGISAFTGSCPEIYLENAFENQSTDRLPVAESIGNWSLAFLVHPTLNSEKLKTTAAKAAEIISTYQADE